MGQFSDETLMARYSALRDEASFTELFSRYAVLLRKFHGRGLWVAADAEDLTQQTFVQVHRARRDFDSGRSFRTWVFAIALNVKRDYLRREGRRLRPVTLESDVAEPPPGEPATVARDTVRGALALLPAAQSAILQARWIDEKPYEAIAREFRTSVGAAKVRVHRALKRLRKLLE